jgi:hypothetical protein
MKKIYLSLIILFGMSYLVSAQTTESVDDSFKPSGKPIITVFSDFSNITSNSKTNDAFEISRAYLGYGYNFSSNFSGRVLFDVANNAAAGTTAPGVSAFTVFLKNAYTEYANNLVKVDFGMVLENMFSLQDSIWGKRYLYKTFQDQYGFGNSADIGAKVKIQFIPEVGLDLAVYNGEGYKKVQGDSAVQVAAGLTVQPIKNLFVRVYYDYMKKTVAQESFSAFIGYKSEKGTLAVEYNTQNGHGMVKDHNFSGISAYGTLPFYKHFSVFGRFDDLGSNKIGAATTDWNTATDGKLYIGGIEYSPIKGIQITPNIRYSDVKVGKATTTIALNLGLNF